MSELKTVTQEMRDALGKPLSSAALKPHPTKANMTSIKPIFITERLNKVFGVGKWSLHNDLVAPIEREKKITSTGKERIEFTALTKSIFTIPEYGIYYDCIASSTNDDAGDAAKGSISDNLSKIGSWMGIGRDVFMGNGDMERKQANQQPAKPKPTPAPATKPTEAKPAIQPSKEFTKPEANLDARKQKASDAYDKLDQAKVLKYLISEKKFSYPTVKEFIEKESIDTVLEVYNHVSSFKK